MARIGSYPIDAVIQDKDAWIGTQNTNRVTRQFTALGVAEYIDTKNVGLVFVGATNLLDGAKGLVPAPVAGQEGMYLKGDLGGGWTTIPVYTLDVPTGTTNVNLINTDGAGGIINSFITLTGGTYLTSVHTSGTQITFNHDLTTRTDTASASSPAAGGTVDIVSSVTSNATGHIEAVNIETVTWPADSDTTYTIDIPNATTSINLAGSDGTNDPIAFTTVAGNNGMTISRTDANTLNFNSKWQINNVNQDGYVPKGTANANKFWATDGNGNPGWTFQPSQDQTLTSTGTSNASTGVVLSQNGGTVIIKGDGSTINASSDNTTNTITLAAINRVNTTYTLPVAAGAANTAVINLTDSVPAIVSAVTFNGTPTGIAISETVGNNGDITIGLQDDITVAGELIVSGAGQSSFTGQLTIPQTPSADTDAASKKYVDDLVAGGLTFRGTFRADTGEILSGVSVGSFLYNCPGGAGTRIAVAVGDYYIVATAGGFFYCSGVTLDIGDSIIATAAAAADASVVTGWSVVQSDEGVASFTNTNGTFISAGTINNASTGAVTMGAIDLSAGGTASATTFLRGDNTWALPAYVSYSAMTTSDLGLGKIKYDFGSTPAAESQSTTTARTYGVTKNASDQLVVNVPWLNSSDVNSVTASGATTALSGLSSTPNTGAVVIGLDINGRASLGVPVGGDELMIYDASTTKNVKVRVDDLAQYVGDGTAVANQVTYWTSANNIGGGTGFTFAGGANGAIAMGGALTVAGTISVASGTISVLGGNNMTLAGPASHGGISFATNSILPATAAATNDNVFDIGATTERFKDGYFGGTVTANNFVGGSGAYLPLAGGIMTGNTIHNDSVKSIYGTSSDGLEIYHNGSNSYIDDSGTGSLFIRSDDNIYIRSYTGNQPFINATKGAGVQLFYNDSQKFETTSIGIEVTGNIKGGSASGSAWTDAKDDIGGLDVFVGSGNTGFSVWDDSYQTAPRFIVERTGNVGIGGVPSEKLTIDGTTSGAYVRISNAASGDISSGYTIYNGSNLDYAVYTNPTFGNTTLLSREALAIRTGGSQSMLIDISGNVGIGKTTSLTSHKLNIKQDASNQQLGLFYDDSNFAAIGAKSNGDCQIYAYNGSSYRNILLGVDGGAVGGNVGIGTDSPESLLAVKGGTAVSDLFSISDNTVPTSGAEYGVMMIKTASIEYAQNITAYGLTSKGLRVYNNGGLVDRTAFSVENASDTNFVVDGLGQVGIGAPALPTDVYTATGGGYATLGMGQSSFLMSYKAGNTTSSIELCQNTYVQTNGTNKGVIASVAAARLTLVDGQFVFATLQTAADKSQTAINAMKIDTSGRVGIGTSSNLSGPLTVQSDGGANCLHLNGRNNGANDEAVISFYEFDGTTRNVYIIKEAGNLAFATGTGGSATERMRITSGGDVEITSGSIYKTNGITVIGNSDEYEFVDALGSGTKRFRPSADGGCNIGELARRFGTIYAVNGTIQTSDVREKTEIKSTQLGLDFVNDLNPVSYKWINSKRQNGEENIKDERNHQGLIAQEVVETLEKHGVDKNEFGGLDIQKTDKYDDFHGMSYEQLLAPMIKAIQELKADNDSLKARIQTLENK